LDRLPIAGRVLPPKAKEDLSFDYFFMHILAHELSHGIGPHQIKVNGRDSSPRQELKELYSAIEPESGAFHVRNIAQQAD
jgi:hypothetical protein